MKKTTSTKKPAVKKTSEVKEMKVKRKDVPKAVIFYGPPGSGKGTQAKLFMDVLGTDKFSQFDTGTHIEKIINDPEALKKPIVQKQRKLFMSGKLCSPEWVISIIDDPIRDFSHAKHGLIFSGSPRTPREAFGMSGKKGTVALLQKYYGLENMIVIWFNIPVAESVKRNSQRGRPGLDEPKTIRIRCQEYKRLTQPIVLRMKKMGIKVVKIDAMNTPKNIHKEVMKAWKEFNK